MPSFAFPSSGSTVDSVAAGAWRLPEAGAPREAEAQARSPVGLGRWGLGRRGWQSQRTALSSQRSSRCLLSVTLWYLQVLGFMLCLEFILVMFVKKRVHGELLP